MLATTDNIWMANLSLQECNGRYQIKIFSKMQNYSAIRFEAFPGQHLKFNVIAFYRSFNGLSDTINFIILFALVWL